MGWNEYFSSKKKQTKKPKNKNKKTTHTHNNNKKNPKHNNPPLHFDDLLLYVMPQDHTWPGWWLLWHQECGGGAFSLHWGICKIDVYTVLDSLKIIRPSLRQCWADNTSDTAGQKHFLEWTRPAAVATRTSHNCVVATRSDEQQKH